MSWLVRGFSFASALAALGCCTRAAPLPRPSGGMAAEPDRDHVATAYRLKLPVWKACFKKAGWRFPPSGLLIRVFKKEAELEVWACNRSGGPYGLMRTYAIAASSGVLGPKRKEGDKQVPEGFYRVQSLNPASAYYLSIKIDYPNRSDRLLGDKRRPGGDIYIHGNRVTIGCLPITDDGIRELYVLVSEFRKRTRRQIPVHIFPARLTHSGWLALRREYSNRPALLRFWSDLKVGFDAFESTKLPPRIRVSPKGRYAVR